MRPVVWGVISTAKIGRERVLPGMKKSGLLEIRAIASRSEASARKVADALGIPKAYGSYAAMLADPEIEAVYIPLPNSMHREWTIKAAEAGKRSVIPGIGNQVGAIAGRHLPRTVLLPAVKRIYGRIG